MLIGQITSEAQKNPCFYNSIETREFLRELSGLGGSLKDKMQTIFNIGKAGNALLTNRRLKQLACSTRPKHKVQSIIQQIYIDSMKMKEEER
jgi:hypothetical protein